MAGSRKAPAAKIFVAVPPVDALTIFPHPLNGGDAARAKQLESIEG
jgi:hypothetical protein